MIFEWGRNAQNESCFRGRYDGTAEQSTSLGADMLWIPLVKCKDEFQRLKVDPWIC